MDRLNECNVSDGLDIIHFNSFQHSTQLHLAHTAVEMCMRKAVSIGSSTSVERLKLTHHVRVCTVHCILS